MIYFDATKTASAGHRSGLVRVGLRLRQEMAERAVSVRWPEWPQPLRESDWYLTPELVAEADRPGLTEFLAHRPCRTAAIFHDAIPLKYPHITWPQSVARHPYHMKLLARFDRVWAVSHASKRELEGFWRWQGLTSVPPVDVLALGADFDGAPRQQSRILPAGVPKLLCVGIVEPRKNQGFLLDVCEQLWAEGLVFELHLVGRVNPHFGEPIVQRLKSSRWTASGMVVFHEHADDATLARLYADARASVFPTIAEGCGLPLLESLWRGLPCVCSDLPVLRENADAGGCVPVPPNANGAWVEALRRVLTDDRYVEGLIREATSRPLPTWSSAVATLTAALG